jgi:hypothetical protein
MTAQAEKIVSTMTLPDVTIAVGLYQKAFGLLQSHAITGRRRRDPADPLRDEPGIVTPEPLLED